MAKYKQSLLSPIPFKDDNGPESASVAKCYMNQASGVIGSLNPIQSLTETISQIISYKYQTKLLEVERKRIIEEVGVLHHRIDASLQAGLKVLEDRRLALATAIDEISKDLSSRHVERLAVINCIESLSSSISNPELSVTEKQCCHEVIATLITTLQSMGDQNTATLNLMVAMTQKELDALPASHAISALALEVK